MRRARLALHLGVSRFGWPIEARGDGPQGEALRPRYVDGRQMLAGLGIDIVEVRRMERELRRGDAGLCGAVFTPGEIAGAARARCAAIGLARCFAAKEALFKALGRAWQGGLCWHGVELCDGGESGPRLSLSGEVRQAADRLGVRRLHVSVSHTELLAMASVVLET